MAAPIIASPSVVQAEPVVVSSVATSAIETTAGVTTSQAVTSVALTTSAEPSIASTSPTAVTSVVPSSETSSAVPITSTTTTIVPSTTSTSIVVPSSISTSTSTTAQPSTSTKVVTSIPSSVSGPALLNPSAVSSKSASASAAKSTSTGQGGIGGSGLPLGGLVGIIIGAIAVLAVIAMLVTRTLRKRQRAKRTASRSSLFEPWPAPVALEDETYEKPGYDNSYPMHSQENYESGYNAPYPADTQPLNYADRHQAQGAYPAMGYNEYPPQGQYAGYAPQGFDGHHDVSADLAADGIAGGGVGAPGGSVGAQGAGLQNESMVRVKVAFVRSLEDELAINPGQQIYLHHVYDDGWSLCEDQANNRGVVPVSCLEPWEETSVLRPSPTDQSLSATSQRRSSLYQANPGQ